MLSPRARRSSSRGAPRPVGKQGQKRAICRPVSQSKMLIDQITSRGMNHARTMESDGLEPKQWYALTPCNFPISMAGWKLGPALTAGRPAGPVNVVSGILADHPGKAIAGHPDKAKVGSTGASQATMAHVARTEMKSKTLELGRKLHQIVLCRRRLGPCRRHHRTVDSVPCRAGLRGGQPVCRRPTHSERPGRTAGRTPGPRPPRPDLGRKLGLCADHPRAATAADRRDGGSGYGQGRHRANRGCGHGPARIFSTPPPCLPTWRQTSPRSCGKPFAL